MPTAALHRQTLSDLLRRTAARWPHKTALVCGDLRWTWAQFDATVSRIAAGLHQAGVASGETVGVLARNSHGFAALRFALFHWPPQGPLTDPRMASRQPRSRATLPRLPTDN